MNSLKLLPVLATLIVSSCSTKTQHIVIQNEFTAGLDEINPSKNKLKTSDFLKYATVENFDALLKEKSATLVVFGMVSNDYSDFEKKYGIKVKTENCVITPGISKIATVNNQIISQYLNEKFSNDWKSDLKFVPFGLN